MLGRRAGLGAWLLCRGIGLFLTSCPLRGFLASPGFPASPWERGGLLRAMFTKGTVWVFPWYLNHSACGDSPSLGTGVESSLWEHRTFPTPNSGILAELLLDTLPPCCCLVQTPGLEEGAQGVRTGMDSGLIPVSCSALRSPATAQVLFLVQDARVRSVCSQQAVRAGQPPCRAKTYSQGWRRVEAGLESPHSEPARLCRAQRAGSVIMRAVQASAWLRGAEPWLPSPASLWGCKQTPHGPASAAAAWGDRQLSWLYP